MEQFKEQFCRGMDGVREEVERVKSNLYLLQMMQDKATSATLGDQHYQHWQRQVKEAMSRRGKS